MEVKTKTLAVAVTFVLLALPVLTCSAGQAYWVVEKSDPGGRRIEVVSTPGKEPATWQIDWVNYVKMIAGPFDTLEQATGRCLEALERAGNYYQAHRCE